MSSWGISCQILSNWHIRSTTSRAGCRALPIMLQMCSIGERSCDLASHDDVWQAVETCSVGIGIVLLKCKPRVAWHEGQFNEPYNFIHVQLCCKSCNRWQPNLLWNEIIPQTITPVCQPVCRKTVRLVSHCCLGHLHTCLLWSSELNSKRDSLMFLIDSLDGSNWWHSGKTLDPC